MGVSSHHKDVSFIKTAFKSEFNRIIYKEFSIVLEHWLWCFCSKLSHPCSIACCCYDNSIKIPLFCSPPEDSITVWLMFIYQDSGDIKRGHYIHCSIP